MLPLKKCRKMTVISFSTASHMLIYKTTYFTTLENTVQVLKI